MSDLMHELMFSCCIRINGEFRLNPHFSLPSHLFLPLFHYFFPIKLPFYFIDCGVYPFTASCLLLRAEVWKIPGDKRINQHKNLQKSQENCLLPCFDGKLP